MNIRCKQFVNIILILCLLVICLPLREMYADEPWPTGPEVNASSAIVIEADTGAVLYEKDIHTQHYPASITKIMTTLLALENSSMQDVVTFSYDSVHKIEGTHIGIKENEQLTMEQCLYSILLASANEVSYAVAEHVGGSVDNFVNMMNERAAAIGCTDTHFNNPHGLPDEAHVTSVHDMALIAQEAYKNPTFRSITKTVSYSVPATNLTAEERPISNHHKMLKRGAYKYDYCTGGKTGYTNAARYTLVTFAEKDDMTLISVVMQCDTDNDQYKDSIALMDYGFNNFHKVMVSESDLGLQLSSKGFFPIEHNPLTEDASQIALSSTAQLVIPNSSALEHVTSNITFTNNNTGRIANVSCTIGEHFIGNVAINYTPGKNVTATKKPSSKTPVTETESKPFPTKKALLILLISICSLGFLFMVLYIIRNGLFERELSDTVHRQHREKMPKKSMTRKRSSANRERRQGRESAEPETTYKPIGTNHTPRLKSEFDIDFDMELDDTTP